MRTIIVTGFEPFGNYEYNPTQDLINEINTKYANRGYDNGLKVIGIVLPCEYIRAFDILKEVIQRENPDAILNIGLSSEAKGIRFEKRFKNKMHHIKYADNIGYRPNHISILENGKPELNTTYNEVFYLIKLLRDEKIHVEVSEDANGFICNSLGYRVANHIKYLEKYIAHVFIHIPWTSDYKGKISLEGTGKIFIEKEELNKAVDIMINHIANLHHF